VTVEPLDRLYFAVDTFSDSGWGAPWSDYKKTTTLDSPALPEEDQRMSNPHLTAPGLLIKNWDNTYVIGESPSTVELLGGASESQNALHAEVRITDDWYWDYTVDAEFYIRVPHGFTVPPGWQHN
jgi:hypothetical protein